MGAAVGVTAKPKGDYSGDEKRQQPTQQASLLSKTMFSRSGSKTSDVTHIGRNENIIMSIMMPVYYTTEPLTEEEINKAAAAWQTILDDTAPEYVRQKDSVSGFMDFTYPSAMTYFFDTFYGRFFDIHPVCYVLSSHRMNKNIDDVGSPNISPHLNFRLIAGEG
jgi:hypothetical protein